MDEQMKKDYQRFLAGGLAPQEALREAKRLMDGRAFRFAD
jgi:hypothetical protein